MDKFKCIKTIEENIFGNKIYFKKDSVYERFKFNPKDKDKELILLSEFNEEFMIAKHWLHYKFDRFFKEHFIKIDIVKQKN